MSKISSQETPLARLASYTSITLIGLITILPFIIPFHTAPLASFYSEWTAVALGFAACIVFLTRGFWSEFDIPKVAFYCFALLLVLIVQAMTIPRPYFAQILIPAIYLFWVILLMIVAVWLRANLGLNVAITAIAWSLLVGTLLHAVTGLVQYLGIAGWLAQFVAIKQGTVVSGNIAQANHFATHITLGIAAAIFLFAQEKISVALVYPLITLLVFAVALSGSRSVLLYAGSLVALSGIYYFKNREKHYLRLLAASIYFFVVFLCSQYLLTWINPWLMEQLAGISLNSDPFSYKSAVDKLPATALGWELRTSEWRKAWLMFMQAPLFGVGVGNYAWHSFQLQSLPEFRNISKPLLFSNSHNIFAQFLAEMGIVGFGTFMLLVIGWINQFRRTFFSPPAWLISGILLVLFIHSNLEFPLWYSYFLGIAGFLLALGDSRTLRLTFSPGLGRIASAFSLLLITSTLVATLNSFQQVTNVSDPVIEPQERINMLLAHGRNPILTPYTELALLALMPETKEEIHDKLAITTRQFRRNPDSFKVYRQITFLALDGKEDEARQLLNQAALVYPYKLTAYIDRLENVPGPEIRHLQEYGTQAIASVHK